MIDDVLFAAALLTTLGCGLVAGVFFAFSTFVVKALARLPTDRGIAAMQSINTVVLDSLFIALLLATSIACVVLCAAALLRWYVPGAGFLLAGAALYLVGSLLVTMLCNVPLNDALAAVDPLAADAASQWTGYLANWMLWNHIRTAAATAATVLLLFALIRATGH